MCFESRAHVRSVLWAFVPRMDSSHPDAGAPALLIPCGQGSRNPSGCSVSPEPKPAN